MDVSPEVSRVLIVEDEGAIADALIYVLEAHGFVVQWVQEGRKALPLLNTFSPSIIILDIGLPDISGLDLCREIRRSSAVPVLFLTARDDEIDRVVGLELGADDYVTKPFSPREVVARVRAILRRAEAAVNTRASSMPEGALSVPVGTLVKDAERCVILFKGEPLPLSRYEYRILGILMERPGWVFSREKLMELVWESPDMSLERTVDTHIKTIRAKLRAIDSEADLIVTNRGFGYSLREDA